MSAFEAFEADAAQRVAVLWGAGGTFCAGADLKAFGSALSNRVQADGAGPMGPSRMVLSKPVIAAVAGHAVAGSWLSGATCAWSRPTRSSASSAGGGACR